MICAYCEKRILYWQNRHSVYKDGFELPSSISLCLFMESIVSLKTMILSFGNFFVIRFIADNILFS